MDRSPVVQLTWTDPVTGRHAYLVIDTLVRGLATGGLRVRAGCTLAEVTGLARGMTRKEAIAYDPAARYLPLGGAKAGVDMDPRDPQARGVLARFLATMLPFLREQWNTGEDLGVRQDDMDEIVASLGLPTTVEALLARVDDPDAARARLAEATRMSVDGIPLADLVGGYGVAHAALSLTERLGWPAVGSTAVVQGFGSMGGATARYLHRAGVRVVAVADRDGLVRNEDGLDVEGLLATRDRAGRIDRDSLRPSDVAEPGGLWLDVPADLLVPAAASFAIGAGDAERVRARMVVEAANMPTVPDAEAALSARGVPVLPDFLANHATNAWWYWVIFGDVEPTPEASFARIATTMRRLVQTVSEESARTGGTLRDAALALADRNAAVLSERFPPAGDGRPPVRSRAEGGTP